MLRLAEHPVKIFLCALIERSAPMSKCTPNSPSPMIREILPLDFCFFGRGARLFPSSSSHGLVLRRIFSREESFLIGGPLISSQF